MKTNFFILLTCLAALLFVSCGNEVDYVSGTYWYQYYIINGTSSQIKLECLTLENNNWTMNTNDTILFFDFKIQNGSDDLNTLHRPSLQDGYEGKRNEGEYELTYQNKVYKIDESQSNSFTKCINYKGIQSPTSDFIYEYYFTIDEDYITTLPLKK